MTWHDLGEQSIGESNSYKSEPNSSIYGQSYARRMCVYVLRLSRAISDHIVRYLSYEFYTNCLTLTN